MPLSGRSTSSWTILISSRFVVALSLKRRIIVEMIDFSSRIAKRCPMQLRGPAANGMKANLWWASTFSGKNRSGSKRSGSLKYLQKRLMMRKWKGKWMRRITSHVSAFSGSIVLKLPFISVNKINLKCDERVFRYPVSAWWESARVSRDCRTAGLLLRVFLAGVRQEFQSRIQIPLTNHQILAHLTADVWHRRINSETLFQHTLQILHLVQITERCSPVFVAENFLRLLVKLRLNVIMQRNQEQSPANANRGCVVSLVWDQSWRRQYVNSSRRQGVPLISQADIWYFIKLRRGNLCKSWKYLLV